MNSNNETIVGYAYASPFKERVAYGWTAETTVYVRKEYHGQGIGKKLYSALEKSLQSQGFLNLIACIAFAPIEDNHLSNSSVRFHEHLGYKEVGHFTKCGYKFGMWYDIVWMEKLLGEHSATPKVVVPIAWNKGMGEK